MPTLTDYTKLLLVPLALISVAACQKTSTIEVLIMDGDDTPDGQAKFDVRLDDNASIHGDYISLTTRLTNGKSVAMVSESGGETKIIVQSGVVTPTAHTVSTLNGLGGPVVNQSGITAFPANSHLSTNPNSGKSELISGSYSGDLDFLLSRDDIEPGGDGQVYLLTALSPAINSAGQIASSVSLFNTSGGAVDDQSIVRIDSEFGLVQPIVRKGDYLPDGLGQFTGTAYQGSQVFYNPYISDDGSVAFTAAITNSGIYADAGLFIGNGLGITEVARTYQQLSTDYQLGIIWGIDYSANGLLAFTAHVVGSTAQDAVYLYDGSTIKTILDPTVTALNGEHFSGPSRTVKVSNNGTAAFLATLYPSGKTGMFVGNDTNLTQIALEGDQAPENRGTFLFYNNQLLDYSMSDNGLIAFEAALTTDAESSFAIYFFNNETLQEVVSTFDTIDGSQVVKLDLAGRTDAQSEAINDAGDIVFTFELADGRQGIAVWRYAD